MRILQTFVIILHCLTCISGSYAQLKSHGEASSEIRIFGLVVNEEDAEEVPYVHIRNLNSGKGTISDLAGEFLIQVKPKDTLIFTAVGYEDYFFTLSDTEITSDSYALKIVLNPSTLELSPVSIFAFKNEAAFKNEILNLKIEDSKREIIIPGAFYGTPEPAKTELYFADLGFKCDGCLMALIDKFRRRGNEQEKLMEHKNMTIRQQEILKKYNPDIVNQITGLTGDRLIEFFDFCEIKDNFVLEANEYEIFVAVNNCYKNFLAVNNNWETETYNTEPPDPE